MLEATRFDRRTRYGFIPFVSNPALINPVKDTQRVTVALVRMTRCILKYILQKRASCTKFVRYAVEGYLGISRDWPVHCSYPEPPILGDITKEEKNGVASRRLSRTPRVAGLIRYTLK